MKVGLGCMRAQLFDVRLTVRWLLAQTMRPMAAFRARQPQQPSAADTALSLFANKVRGRVVHQTPRMLSRMQSVSFRSASVEV
jgi:hypothetical protein